MTQEEIIDTYASGAHIGTFMHIQRRHLLHSGVCDGARRCKSKADENRDADDLSEQIQDGLGAWLQMRAMIDMVSRGRCIWVNDDQIFAHM